MKFVILDMFLCKLFVEFSVNWQLQFIYIVEKHFSSNIFNLYEGYLLMFLSELNFLLNYLKKKVV